MKKKTFRVWDENKKGWIEDRDLFLLSDGSVCVGGLNDIPLTRLDEKNLVFGTFLKDMNGKEIFEGDILEREYEITRDIYHNETLGFVEREIVDSGTFIGVVCYRPSEGWVLNKCKKLDSEGNLIKKMSGVKIYAKYCKVIGNKFEDADILK